MFLITWGRFSSDLRSQGHLDSIPSKELGASLIVPFPKEISLSSGKGIISSCTCKEIVFLPYFASISSLSVRVLRSWCVFSFYVVFRTPLVTKIIPITIEGKPTKIKRGVLSRIGRDLSYPKPVLTGVTPLPPGP